MSPRCSLTLCDWQKFRMFRFLSVSFFILLFLFFLKKQQEAVVLLSRLKQISGVYSEPSDVFVLSIKETALVLEDVSVCSHPSCSGRPADLSSLKAPLKFYPSQSNLTSRKLGHIESQWREKGGRSRRRRRASW